MSDKVGDLGSGTGTKGPSSGLYDERGRALKRNINRDVNRAAGQLQQIGNQADDFIHSQPIAAVFLALGIGYVLGRIGL
jgi:ElaB/YqjD/DUF883 family membrane-anchored ribosome-binding protein